MYDVCGFGRGIVCVCEILVVVEGVLLALNRNSLLNAAVLCKGGFNGLC